MNNSNKKLEDPTVGIFSRLPEISISLETDLNNIEPRFAQLGQDLQMVYTESDDMAKGIMNAATGMTDKSQDGLLHHVGKIVDDSLSVLSGYRKTITGSLENINESTGHLTRLCSICEIINKSAVFLNIVGLNIGVESCRSKEAATMFENFGGEIKDLAEKINKISSTIQDDSEKIKRDQLAVHTDITGNVKTFSELSKSAETAVQSAMEEIETISKLASSTLEKAGHHSGEISKIVGEIVMAIQFHDIARQQIEHIISALGDVLTFLNTGTEDSESPDETAKNEAAQDESKKKGRIQSILALQAAHLRQVVSETDSVYKKMQTAFGSIGGEVDLLMENVAMSSSEEMEGTGLEQGFKNFKAKLEELLQLLDRGNDLEGQIKKNMDQSSRAVSTLSHYTDQVSGINIALQYKAINAIIMTTKLGQKGATLEVLARSVRDLSNESNTSVTDVLEIIRSITDLAVLSDPVSTTRSNDEMGSGTDNISLNSGISSISTVYEEYRQSVLKAEERSGKLSEFIEKAGKGLGFLPEWIEKSKWALNELDDLLEALAPWEGMGEDLSASGEDDIAQRYTMESERKIHEQLAGMGEVEENKEGLGKNHGKDVFFDDLGEETPGEEDELDDNIELF